MQFVSALDRVHGVRGVLGRDQVLTLLRKEGLGLGAAERVPVVRYDDLARGGREA